MRKKFEYSDHVTVEIGDRIIGVIHYDGTYYALEKQCPFWSGPVCDGKLQGALQTNWPVPGERPEEYFSDAPVVACPWHGWEFDLKSGCHLDDNDIQISTFDVVIVNRNVYVELTE